VAAAFGLAPPPEPARIFRAGRRVRLADVTPAGRLRLDAVARYLQDVATDDVTETGVPGPWVLRRQALEIEREPRYNELVTLATWCSGIGSRWAERRTTVSGANGAAIESVALWVLVDAASGRPARLEPTFFTHYELAASGRTVRARLEHPDPPPNPVARQFTVRATDLDVLDHVNNAVFWVPVEEELARARSGIRPVRAELEYRGALELESDVNVVVEDNGESDPLALWLCVGSEVRASARVWTR